MGKEFDESKHPRDETGKFTDAIGTKAEQEKMKDLGISIKDRQTATTLTNEEKRLQEITGEKIKGKKVQRELTEEAKKLRREKKKNLIQKIKKLEPVQLKLKDKNIVVEFDTYCAKKNIYAQGKSDRAGWKWKQQSIDKFRKIIAKAIFIKTSKEKGKNKKAHIGVKEWHYFRSTIKTRRRRYEVLINIRDKGEKKYVYEIKVTKLKIKKA